MSNNRNKKQRNHSKMIKQKTEWKKEKQESNLSVRWLKMRMNER